VLYVAAAVALAAATPAFAGFRPIVRTVGDLTLPRVQAGEVRIPAGHADGRVTMIVDLPLPPLAAAGRTVASRTASSRLDVHGRSSRTYLARLAVAQDRTVAELRRAIPTATVSNRFRILLDAITVDLPAKQLPTLVKLGFVRHVYPSARYALKTNESPSIIGADVLRAATGADGAGIKIGVVDDGIDQTNPFLDPTGYSYPPGFPKGGLKWTSEKVIVARVFPGPTSGRPGRLALDPASSFHGTHVAGIAAGDAGTNAPAGRDHPAVPGLSGVAPKAWLGNYRVFTVPTPIGHVANTPQIIAAFEAAVADGMDVINFSGGGPNSDPANDPMIETVHNVAVAGVVPVIAAGNDRDDFGLGSVGSPGTAPDAITVAAVSSNHVFSPALTVDSPALPGTPAQIPIQVSQPKTPAAWASSDQTLVDVGAIVGKDGQPVEAHVCGAGVRVNDAASTQLPAHSLDGAIALVSRGICTFTSKAQRVKDAGAAGVVIVDNRPAEANPIPVALPLPGGMISSFDGSRLRAIMAGTGGRAQIKIGTSFEQIVTNRGGVPTSFSSAGPNDFGHALKPDISAPGGQILSSTLPQAGGPFAVFDGTSMATPHIAGAVADLLELHRGWTPGQIKSALMSTAGPTLANSGSTSEAPVLVEGAGLANVNAADDPKIFTNPQSLSFRDLNVSNGAQDDHELLTIDDAVGGGGTWQVALEPQSATMGASLTIPSSITIPPGGYADLAVAVHAAVDAQAGEDYGFVTLTSGTLTRRVPYACSVTRPGLKSVTPVTLKSFQVGDTLHGQSHADVYRYPAAPFGPAPNYTGSPMDESGAEKVYVTHVNEAVANIGVSVLAQSAGALIDPFFLGSLDENSVQGYAGTPVNVNSLMADFRFDVSAAGVEFPRQQEFFVSVDSGRDPFTDRALAGNYVLHSWVNDVSPPLVELVTRRVAAGRPLVVARVVDLGSGVDPFSLVLAYRRILLAASAYDPATGYVLFGLPPAAPSLPRGSTSAIVVASDLQETKNINTGGTNIMPNTAYAGFRLQVVNGPATTWLAPEANVCVTANARLAVAASSTSPIVSVRFRVDGRTVATVKRTATGLYSATWRAQRAKRGTHELTAEVRDRSGHSFTATRRARVCAPPKP
jgi:minor extracellular serine protease Vpr